LGPVPEPLFFFFAMVELTIIDVAATKARPMRVTASTVM